MPFLGDARPASTFIGPAKLAMPDWMVEVECTAAIPTQKVEEKATEEVDVVVVDTGLSGLETALNLERDGISPLALEAKDRVCGKTCRVSNCCKGAVKHGEAWINDTNQTEMWALCQHLVCAQASDGSVTTRPHGTETVSRSSSSSSWTIETNSPMKTEDQNRQFKAFKGLAQFEW
jgi:cation diffusion facilitator CzcD-associated flavoprotein CzcO